MLSMLSNLLSSKAQHSDRFSRSNELLERALKTIPVGSQTFSKSHLQMPQGKAPLFLERGKGSRCIDVDGNEYVDLIMGLAPLTLGYCDPDVDQAIKIQMERGITYSMPSILEVELAERIVKMVPCAEMVRFGKNGSDATSGGIRLARAHTGRDKIIVCGYHGWHDWYIGSTARHLGVPKATQNLTVSIPYNDLEALAQVFKDNPGEIAALIMEPMSADKPLDGYLESVKEMVHKNGALLIFDEVITGFRYAKGGAQEYFGVVPDLAAFGKAMANGMPLSAITGRADVMKKMNDIFFSGTFGGETLSLAASIAVLDKIENEPVLEHLWSMGADFQSALLDLIKHYDLQHIFHIKGQHCYGIIAITPPKGVRLEALKTVMLQKLIENNLLTLGVLVMNYAFKQDEKRDALKAFGAMFAHIAEELKAGVEGFEDRMSVPAIEPIFQVRKSN